MHGIKLNTLTTVNSKKKKYRWNDANILRFLYANKFKFEKTFKAIQSHSEWRQIKIPAKYTTNIQNFLVLL